ncbi:hypothetical protein C5Y96_23650 [Blastopirellula marina]|uniref:Carboxypeptidase regulatory-like domain-containing protein n=1 Tax=Blastopirellula marina TaxID=124 RepID=A0A2S8F0V3_9BACT|nr:MULTISPECIES: hypothetical protein [Pirellulaceae]PQO25805.1 hypothetical protein C5Y96_23650 [Blastopirellula marina]RCS43488.1 hypothetical protein DTL36_23700 [Bremerella cremea]
MKTTISGLRTDTLAFTACLLLIGCLTSLGCQAKSSDRFVLSGEATYDGKPIPSGELIFTPDTGRGNKGPQGKARIVDGKFSTENNGRGVVGGPHRVELRAYDGVPYDGREMKVEEGKPLFGSLMAEIDLPADSAILDAVVETEGKKPQFVLTVSQ